MSFPRGHLGHFGGRGYTIQSVLFPHDLLASLLLPLNETLARLAEELASARHSHVLTLAVHQTCLRFITRKAPAFVSAGKS